MGARSDNGGVSNHTWSFFLRHRSPTKGQSYEVVADWMGVRGISREKFVSDLNRTYALLGTKKLLEKQGFNVSSEVKQKDGSIKVVLKKREFVKA